MRFITYKVVFLGRHIQLGWKACMALVAGDESLEVARKMLTGIREAEAEHVATDCPLAALRIEEGLGRKAAHPVVLMARAYGIPVE